MSSLVEDVGIGNEHFPEFGSATVTQAEFSRVRTSGHAFYGVKV